MQYQRILKNVNITPNCFTFSESEDTMNPGVYKVTVGGEQKIDCKLKFQPTEVASYDFIMPVSINQTDAPTPDSTPAPPTPAPSSKSIQHIIAPRPVVVTVATPRRRIIATGLRQPLQLSHYKLEFSLPSGFLELGVNGTAEQIEGETHLSLTSISAV